MCPITKGKAFVVNSSDTSKLNVLFIPLIMDLPPRFLKIFVKMGNYWILKVITRESGSENYDLAYVASPNRKYLWLLSKTESVTEQEYADFIYYAQTNNFNLTNLRRIRT
ncbi:hypothetical protein MHBO_002272 [Bonamia ostreae]|uniref:Lipocalin/cytosolic fatty-acid binding domain-containing protein n=1 Tax=Bonamia ostreae TaxID=126728 RepID=A0ABV2AMK0_9EUKA